MEKGKITIKIIINDPELLRDNTEAAGKEIECDGFALLGTFPEAKGEDGAAGIACALGRINVMTYARGLLSFPFGDKVIGLTKIARMIEGGEPNESDDPLSDLMEQLTSRPRN